MSSTTIPTSPMKKGNTLPTSSTPKVAQEKHVTRNAAPDKDMDTPTEPNVFEDHIVITQGEPHDESKEESVSEVEEIRNTDSTEPTVSADALEGLIHLAGAYVVIGTYLGQQLRYDVARMRSPEDIMSTVLLYDALKHFTRLTTKFPGLSTLDIKDLTVKEGRILARHLRIEPFAFYNIEKQWTKIVAHGNTYHHEDAYNELAVRPPYLPGEMELALDKLRLATPFGSIRMHESTVIKSFRVRAGITVNMFPYPNNPFKGKPYEIVQSQEHEIRKELEATTKELAELRPLRDEVSRLTAALEKRNADYTLAETKYCNLLQAKKEAEDHANKTVKDLRSDVRHYKRRLEDSRQELKECKAKEQRPEDIVQNLPADLVKEIIISSLSKKRPSLDTSCSDDHSTSRCTEVDTETDDDDKPPSRTAKRDAKKRDNERSNRDASGGHASKRTRRH